MLEKIFEEVLKKAVKSTSRRYRQHRTTYRTKIYAEGRICAGDGCETILNMYNKNAYCGSCRMRNPFYRSRDADSMPVRTITSDGHEALTTYGGHRPGSIPKEE